MRSMFAGCVIWNLDYGRRRDILDIGSGAGYFLYLCQWLGHRPLGLDVDDVPLYPEMTQMLGVKRMISAGSMPLCRFRTSGANST